VAESKSALDPAVARQWWLDNGMPEQITDPLLLNQVVTLAFSGSSS
jgi:hypothetical protein